MIDRYRGAIPFAWLVIGILVTAGCHEPESAITYGTQEQDTLELTTPSVEAAWNFDVEHPVLQRPYAVDEAWAKNGSVTHTPLYFEDPFEAPRAGHESLAWSGEDYFMTLYGPGRMVANAILFPVSAVVTPPWRMMVSEFPMDSVPPAEPADPAE